MTRIILALALALVLSDAASAGCRNRYCYQCYPQTYQKTYAKEWSWQEALAKIAARKADNEAFTAGLAQVAGAPVQPAGVVAYGSPAYSATIQGVASSYPVQGSTLYGQYGTNPIVQSAANQQAYQRFLAMALQGTHQGMMDQADLAKIEGETNAELAKIAAIASSYDKMAAATKPAGEFRKLEFQMQFDPATQQVTVVQPPAAGAEQHGTPGLTFAGVIAGKCASCHSGEHAQGGVDLTGEISSELFEKIVTDVRTGKMPMMKDEQGNFVDGPDLSNEEMIVICNEAYLNR